MSSAWCPQCVSNRPQGEDKTRVHVSTSGSGTRNVLQDRRALGGRGRPWREEEKGSHCLAGDVLDRRMWHSPTENTAREIKEKKSLGMNTMRRIQELQSLGCGSCTRLVKEDYHSVCLSSAAVCRPSGSARIAFYRIMDGRVPFITLKVFLRHYNGLIIITPFFLTFLKSKTRFHAFL